MLFLCAHREETVLSERLGGDGMVVFGWMVDGWDHTHSHHTCTPTLFHSLFPKSIHLSTYPKKQEKGKGTFISLPIPVISIQKGDKKRHPSLPVIMVQTHPGIGNGLCFYITVHHGRHHRRSQYEHGSATNWSGTVIRTWNGKSIPQTQENFTFVPHSPAVSSLVQSRFNLFDVLAQTALSLSLLSLCPRISVVPPFFFSSLSSQRGEQKKEEG